MPFSSGIFSRVYNWATEQLSPPIEVSKLDQQEEDFATGLSNCILRDGTGIPTANQDWNSKKITNLADATAAADALNRQTADARYLPGGTLATDRLLGRDTAGSGPPEALTVGGGLEFTGSGGIQRSALTGDVTASAGSNSTTLSASAVLAKLLTVDGAGSGLDADLLDGNSSAAFAAASHGHAASDTTSGTFADARIAASNVAQHVAKNISAKSGTAKTLSTSAPSGGSDGDIWYRY